jgi:MFS family permease
MALARSKGINSVSSTTILLLGLATAVAAAVRSTWSPCGWSMLSTITPLSERGRGHRFGPVGLWFVAGAALGGLALGALGALGTLVVAAVEPTATQAAVAAGIVLLVAATWDADLLRPALPHHRRQVDEEWLDRFRPWVYGGGFGVQIGTGLATYIMTTAVYAVVMLAALTGRPLAAFGVGLAFGTTRGLAVFASRRCTTFERLSAFHRRFASLATPVRLSTIATEVALAVVAGAFAGGTGGAVVAGLMGSLVLVHAVRAGADHTSLPAEARLAAAS